MDAPKGRYRIEEKDGRLTVIDTFTGVAATPPSGSPPPKRNAGPLSTPPGLLDRIGRLLLTLVVSRWDDQGRAVLAWQWEQNGRKRHWDASLGPAHQRRLGRALIGATAFPLLVLFTILFGADALWLLLPFALPATFWGVWAVMRLKRETGTTEG